MRALLVLLLTAAIAGCSASGHKPAAAPRGFRDLAALCTAMGAGTFVEDVTPHELGTADEGNCDRDPTTIVYLFASPQAVASWYGVAKIAGGTYLVGDRWAISPDDASKARVYQAKVGGTVRS